MEKAGLVTGSLASESSTAIVLPGGIPFSNLRLLPSLLHFVPHYRYLLLLLFLCSGEVLFVCFRGAAPVSVRVLAKRRTSR